MPSLFAPSRIKNMTLANRFVRSATHEGLADMDGKATPELNAVLTRLAEGEVGLIISGHTAVTPQGRARPRQLMAHDDSCLQGLTAIATAVHAAKGVIALQIAHAGVFAQPVDPAFPAAGPSVLDFPGAPVCAAFTEAELDSLVQAFAAAALRGRKAGFDAVQIHAAHTYMLSQFLSPFFNRRTDSYGGSLENRARLLLRVVEAVREAIGQDCPLLVKINAEDFLDQGLSRQDSLAVALLLEKAGVDAIELSGGSFLPFAGFSPSRKGLLRGPEDELYYREAARDMKARLSIPLMLVGGVHSLEGAEQVLRDGLADYVSLCRPLICEPDLIKKWRLGLSATSECLSDNLCFTPLAKLEGVHCVTWAKKRGESV